MDSAAYRADPFDALLSLEDQYHHEGYTLGLADGARAGRIEGRTFGLEKGFEKYLELGRLNGRADIWKSRLSSNDGSNRVSDSDVSGIQRLEASERLRKHINRLHDLTDPETISTENSEGSVEDFDGRLKDAKAKATLISRTVGETDQSTYSNQSTEDGSRPGSSRGRGVMLKGPATGDTASGAVKGKKTGEMEDFEGVVPISKSKDAAKD